MRDIIITGSSGLIGTEVTSFFKKTDTVKECDLSLGHDLNDESFVKDFFKEMPEVIKKLLQIYPHSWKVKSFLFQ